MNQGIYPLAATMINQFNRVDVLANNLANANTTAFKQDHLSEGSFNSYLKNAQEQNKETNKINSLLNTIPKLDTKYTDKRLGAITPTTNQLDFAIKDSQMFFKVQDPKTKDIYLTRDGSFSTLNGKLSTKNGHLVLSKENQSISIENGFEKSIALVKTKFENLTKEGDNNYSIISEQNINTENSSEYLMQGALEKSNVNSITTMVALIDSHRRLEQAQKAMTGIDEINQKVIDKIGSGR